jgi:hypothetical protein
MKKFQLELTDEEVKILENDLLSIYEWIAGAIAGKINNCKKRAAIAYREKLKAEGAEMVPANDDVAVAQLFAREDYKNRKQREAESL